MTHREQIDKFKKELEDIKAELYKIKLRLKIHEELGVKNERISKNTEKTD